MSTFFSFPLSCIQRRSPNADTFMLIVATGTLMTATSIPEVSQYVGYSVAVGGVVIGALKWAQKIMVEVNKLRAISRDTGKKKRRSSSRRRSGRKRSNVLEFPPDPH